MSFVKTILNNKGTPNMLLIDAIGTISKFINTAVISPRETYFGDMSQAYFGMIKLTDPALTTEIGLYDEINNLSRMLSLFEDPEIQIEGSKLKIQEDDTEAYFITSDISLIRKGDFDQSEQLKRTLEAPKCLTVNFTDSLINRLSKAAGSIDNAALIIASQGGKVTLSLKDIDILSSDSNSFTIDITEIADANREFQVKLDPSVVNRMPKGGFELELTFSERVGSYRAVFKQEQLLVVAACNKVDD